MQNMNGKSALGLDANVAALLCYVPVCAINLIFSILVIVQDKTNKVARFHAFQSLFLMIASIVISIPLYIVMFVGVFVDSAIGFPIVSLLVGLGALVFGLALLFFLIMAAIKAFGGQIYKIPVIGNFAEKYSN
jgi:uncharacterized membrane protein